MPSPVRLRPSSPIVSSTSWMLSTLMQPNRYRHVSPSKRRINTPFESVLAEVGKGADIRRSRYPRRAQTHEIFYAPRQRPAHFCGCGVGPFEVAGVGIGPPFDPAGCGAE